jgi:hypothetical protein
MSSRPPTTFDAEERVRYVACLASVTVPGGTLHVLCFSDHGPDTGPARSAGTN